MTSTLRIGTAAPDFDARDQTGRRVSLSDFRGQWVVLYFYPKDRTVGCTAEACAFRDLSQEWRKEGAVVLGVSRDDLESHEDFARRQNLGFRLLADPAGRIVDAYQAGGWFGVPRRITYLIDPDGHIARAYAHVSPRRHPQVVLNDLRELKGKRQSAAKMIPLPAV